MIAFGSSYRTPDGHVEVPQTAEQLLDRGIAPRLRSPQPACAASQWSRASERSACMTRTTTRLPTQPRRALPTRSVLSSPREAPICSWSPRGRGAAEGQLLLSGTARERVEQAPCPVLRSREAPLWRLAEPPLAVHCRSSRRRLTRLRSSRSRATHDGPRPGLPPLRAPDTRPLAQPRRRRCLGPCDAQSPGHASRAPGDLRRA